MTRKEAIRYLADYADELAETWGSSEVGLMEQERFLAAIETLDRWNELAKRRERLDSWKRQEEAKYWLDKRSAEMSRKEHNMFSSDGEPTYTDLY